MAGKILVVADAKGGKLRKSAFEGVSQACRVAEPLSWGVQALVIGKGNAEAAGDLCSFGAEEVLTVSGDAFESYSTAPYVRAVVEACRKVDPELVLFSTSAQGRDLAPAVAAALEAGMASDCTGIEAKDGEIEIVRPVYAGKAYVTLKLTSKVKVASLRPNVFPAGEPDPGRERKVSTLDVAVEESDLRAKLLEIIEAESEKPDLTEADVIVSGGRGMKGAENWHVIEALAEALGGVVGASRAVVDSGWRPHSEQVGQTGKTVSANLYIACGISGAIQHLAGMQTSRCIVAINKDPEAPIFKVADYGIVGDLFEVVPALTEEIEKLRAE